MKNRKPMSACIISTVLALVLMIFTYVALLKVDFVYTDKSGEIYRQEDVGIFSEIENPADNIDGGEGLSFTYVDGEKTVDFDHTSFDLKIAIAKLAVKNFIDFNWSDANNVIIFSAK